MALAGKKTVGSHSILVLDQGSHASRAALFSESGELLQLESIDIATHSPSEGHYEQSANEILHSIQSVLSRIKPQTIPGIKCCGLCTQRSSIVAWHKKSGEALSPVISWRDTRSQDSLENLMAIEPDVRKITGLPVSAHYSASKIQWLLQNNKKVQQAATDQQLFIAPLASFLLFHLLDDTPHVIDHSNAQRTQLFDIQCLNWSDKLLKLFQLDKALLPECKPVIYHYGQLKGTKIPVTAVCGDQNAALHAYPRLGLDNALINIGTGAFILSNSEERTETPGLLNSISCSRNNTADYVTEGTVNGAGAALSWAQKEIRCDKLYNQLPGWLRQIQDPPVFLNTVSGLGSPWWCDAGQAEFIGIDGKILSQAERYVAIIESIIFLIYKNILQLKSPPHTIFISGGLSQLDGLCQKLADLSQSRLLRFTEKEASARGCAWLALRLSQANDHHWKPLETEHQFNPSENSKIIKRYEQFVGELQKRCRKD